MDIQVGYVEPEEELQAVLRLRYEIYIQEMHLESASADHERMVLSDAYDDTVRILYAQVDGEIAGTARLRWGVGRRSLRSFCRRMICGAFNLQLRLNRWLSLPVSWCVNSIAARLFYNLSKVVAARMVSRYQWTAPQT